VVLVRDDLPWSLIILTGGSGRRLGGAEKSQIEIGNSTLLERAITPWPETTKLIVSGPEEPTSRPVIFCREDPPGGGPAAGIAAAIDLVSSDLVGVLAVDMPWSAPVLLATRQTLMDHPESNLVVPIGPDGRHQLLCSLWRTADLRTIVESLGDLHGRPVRDLVERASMVTMPVDPSDSPLLDDIDTPSDVTRARLRDDEDGDHPTDAQTSN